MRLSVWRKVIPALLLALLLTTAVVTAASNAQGVTRFVRLFTRTLIVELETELWGDLEVTGDTTLHDVTAQEATITEVFAGRVEVGGEAEVQHLTLDSGSVISVTAGFTITPQGVGVPLESAGNVGTSNIVTTTASLGSVILLWNTVDTTITITDTGHLVLAGDAALGQYDTLLLMFDGTRWVEISRSNN